MNDSEDLIRRKAIARRMHNAAIVYDRMTGGAPVYSTRVGSWRTEVNIDSLHPVVAARLGLAKTPHHVWVGDGAARRCRNCRRWWVDCRNKGRGNYPKCETKGDDECG